MLLRYALRALLGDRELTQIGPDPDRVPGWTANGIEPWGLQRDPIGSPENLFFRGSLTLLLAIHREVSGEATSGPAWLRASGREELALARRRPGPAGAS